MSEYQFHLDYLLLFLRFPMLTLSMNNNCCSLNTQTNTYSKLARETPKTRCEICEKLTVETALLY